MCDGSLHRDGVKGKINNRWACNLINQEAKIDEVQLSPFAATAIHKLLKYQAAYQSTSTTN